MKNIILVFAITFICSCGYYPVSKTAQNIFGDDVFVDVEVSKTDPKNTVEINDAIRSGIIKRLNKNITTNKNADSTIYAKVDSIKFIPLSYNQMGYANVYQAILHVTYDVHFKDGTRVQRQTSGDYEFTIARLGQSKINISSTISYQERYEAIKNAAEQSFDEFIANLAIYSLRK